MKPLTIQQMSDWVALSLRQNTSGTPTEGDLDAAIEQIAKFHEITGIIISPDEKAAIKRTLQARLVVNMDVGIKIIDEDTYRPWLAHRKAEIEEYYWNRYKKFLLDEKRWADNVVNTLDKDGDEILDLMGNPMNKFPWKRKGLVLGDIQSGKTSTYLALMNKAADAGYKLIILLSGTIEALRKQTQERIDEGFVGLNSRNVLSRDIEKKYVGVGLFDKQKTAFPLTDIISDFDIKKLQALGFNAKSINDPIVFVVKKNVTVLKNLYAWINNSLRDTEQERIDAPLLLIDDEADNASINTRKPELDPTAINRSIRKILHLFNRSTYLAVTATPFANIFINPDDDDKEFLDLFPSDFIYSLSPPDNYFGSNAMFGDNPVYSDCIKMIWDADGVFSSTARASHIVTELPDTLKDAIGYFLLCNVIRDRRGVRKDHRSMLVNVSAYTLPQESVYDLIDIFLDRLQKDIKAYSKLGPTQAIKVKSIANLSRIWSEMDLDQKAECTFEDIIPLLSESVVPIKVTMVNTKSKSRGLERLDYKPYEENGYRVIVVGGNSLSRGITLEGLCVSYFYRESKMYDTLQQMGRWFGYRPGYGDLVKVWMSERTNDWFEFINKACDELRSEINYMNKLGQTPSDFGLKVREHPDTLMITASNKMRSAQPFERWISLSGKLVETPWLMTKTIDYNNNLTNTFLSEALQGSSSMSEDKRLYFGIPSKRVAEFIRNFASHPSHLVFNSREIGDYIDKNSSYLEEWFVYIPDGSDDSIIEIVDLKIKRLRRTMLVNSGCIKVSGNKSRIGSPGDVKIILSEPLCEESNKAYVEYLKARGEYDPRKPLRVPDHFYLRYTSNPVLIISFMVCNPSQKDIESYKTMGDRTVVGLSLGFPRTDVPEEKARYKINPVEQKKLMTFDDSMEGDEEDED
jgi:hypothetical protein